MGNQGLLVEFSINDPTKIRKPKAEIRKKSEIRSPNPECGLRMVLRRSVKRLENLSTCPNALRGLRISGFGVLSEFGSRISGFATLLSYPLKTSKNLNTTARGRC